MLPLNLRRWDGSHPLFDVRVSIRLQLAPDFLRLAEAPALRWDVQKNAFQIGHYYTDWLFDHDIEHYCNTHEDPWWLIESLERINCSSFRWSCLLLVWPVGNNTLGTVSMQPERGHPTGFPILRWGPIIHRIPNCLPSKWSIRVNFDWGLGILLQILKYPKLVANYSE